MSEEAPPDPAIHTALQLGDIIELHEETDWSQVPMIDAVEVAPWVDRLKAAQREIGGIAVAAEADVTPSETASTAGAFAVIHGDEYADVAADWRVRGPTTDQRVEVEADTKYGQVALSLDCTEAAALSRLLSVAVTECEAANTAV